MFSTHSCNYLSSNGIIINIMNSKNQNYLKLEKYFAQCIESNIEIPFITKASVDTGISAATITRFARKNGYYGYPDMRSELLKKITVGIKEEKEYTAKAIKLMEFLHQNEKIIIYTSVSTKPVGYFLLDRLKTMKSNVVMLEDLSTLSTLDHAAITITVSGESARIEKFMKNKRKFKDVLMISCTDSFHEPNSIILNEYMYKTRTNISLFRTLRKMNE